MNEQIFDFFLSLSNIRAFWALCSLLVIVNFGEFAYFMNIKPPIIFRNKRVKFMSVCSQLQNVVQNYFTKFPHMSVNALALKSGVPATTLRRIVAGSVKGEPAPHTVLNIVSAINNENKLEKLVKVYEGPIKEYLVTSFGNFLSEIETNYSLDLNEVLRDQITYFIFKLCANRVGTDLVDVSGLFGKLGVDKLNYLVSKGLVVVKNEKYHAVTKNFSLDYTVAATHLQALVGFYKPHQVSAGKNLFYTLSESINEEGILKIKEIQKEAIKKIHNIMKSPFYEGEIPFFTLDMCDTLDLGQNNEVVQ